MSDQKEPTEVFADPPALPGRWTVCAMLFVATSINYMDRQVIAILKPVLAQTTIHLAPLLPGWPVVETSIGMTEQQFGYIVSAFSTAYMLGVIFAGRLVDRLGCRRGYPIVTGLWSLSAMGHSLVNSVFGFGVARFFLGLGESGNFPAAIKATAEWFPPKERSLATGIFNSGASVGAILAPAIVPWVAWHFGWRASFLTTGVFSATWIVWWSVKYRTPAQSMDWSRGAAIAPAPQMAWWKLLGYPADLGICVRQVSHRSGLVVFSVLAAGIFQRSVQPEPVAPGRAVDCDLLPFHCRECLRGLAAPWLRAAGHGVKAGAAGCRCSPVRALLCPSAWQGDCTPSGERWR